MRKLLLALLLASPLAAQTRIACGHSAPYTDSMGNVWAADNSVSGGTPYSVTAPISGTPNSGLFDSLRYGVFTYTIAVPNGSYSVNLEFAETWANAAGVRVFSMQINGVSVLTNFDVFAKVGKNAADIETFPVTVTNGSIVIRSVAVTQSPILNAIDVEPGTPPPFVWVMPGLGTATFTMYVPPACGPSDGACSITIMICDMNNNCTTGNTGSLYLIKTSSLPNPQVLTIPVVTVTQP
jgi:hypothetical protein